MATGLKFLGIAVIAGAVIKASIIGYYVSDTPILLAALAAGGALMWIGSRVDGWGES